MESKVVQFPRDNSTPEEALKEATENVKDMKGVIIVSLHEHQDEKTKEILTRWDLIAGVLPGFTDADAVLLLEKAKHTLLTAIDMAENGEL